MTQSGHCDRKPGQCVLSANPRSTTNLARASPLGLIFLALQKATNVSGSTIMGLMMLPSRFAFATRLFREQLPLIEARRKPVAILHNFPDTLIVLASKPRNKVCHRDVPPMGFSLKSNTSSQRGKGTGRSRRPKSLSDG